MADIFNRAGNQFGGSFASDAAKIVFGTGGTGSGDVIGGSGGVGLLTQTAQLNYSQQITRLYEIGSNFTFLVAGRTQGGMSLGRILGPRKVQTAFYQNYGNVCNASNNNLSIVMETGCPTGAGSNGGIGGGLGTISFLIKNLVIVSLGISVAAQDMIVSEQLQAMFVSLEIAG